MGLDNGGITRIEQRWVTVYNQSGEDIPPLSFCTPVGVAANGGLIVDQVSEDGDKMAMVTGDTWIVAGGWGLATRDFPARVTYDSSDGNPAALTIEDWGPAAGDWLARKDVAGWKLIGPAVDGMPEAELTIDTAFIEIEVCRPA